MEKTVRIKRGYAAIDASMEHGAEPGIPGPVIEKIIPARRAKRYYRLGKPAEKRSVILKKYLPERIFENLVRKYYNT